MGKPNVDLKKLAGGDLSVDALLAESIERVIWDTIVPGLGLRVRQGRQPCWIIQRRIKGRSLKRALGSLDAIDLDKARDVARDLLDDLAQALPATSPTLAVFIPVFLDDCAGRWKPSTLSGHRSNLMSMVLPALGDIPLHALARADVVNWFEGVGCKTASGNRALSVLSLVMQHAELLGLRPKGSNPCVGLQYRRSHFEARYLTGDDFFRLGIALKRLALDHPMEVAAIRFLLLTGARRGEALALEWSFIEGPRAVLPDSKTGPKTLWLSTPARKLLAGMSAPSPSALVFARPDGRSIKHSLGPVWREARKLAALDGMRLHDLRHSYASVAVSMGEELRTVAGLLGHADLGTTAGYAHLAEKPIADAAARVSSRLAKAMIPANPVTPIRPRPPRPPKSPRPPSQPKPEPILPPEPSLPDRDKPWVKHIKAFHKSPLRLDPFCAKKGLDPKEMGQALARHFKRRKERAAQLAALS